MTDELVNKTVAAIWDSVVFNRGTIEQIVREALAAVREECAKVAEEWGDTCTDYEVNKYLREVAQAIRQQGLPCSRDGASANIRTGP